MDIIAGFGEESQEEFEESYLRLKNLPWTRMHVFPYSPRNYTFANRYYKTLPRSVIMKRAALLRHLSESRYQLETQKQMGSVKKILPLKKSGVGLSRDYWVVHCSKLNHSTAQEMSVKVNSVNLDKGVLISEE